MPQQQRLLLFCDIDGTLVHYPDSHGGRVGEDGSNDGPCIYNSKDGTRASVLLLPPSTTGMQGMISMHTLERLQYWRSLGHYLVIISGARTSTVLQRLPYLPKADAVVSENGGRIWLLDDTFPTACGLREDLEWRHTHAATTGPPSVEAAPPAQRPYPLWQLYNTLEQEGWVLDAQNYSTAFRIKVKPPKTQHDLDTIRSSLPQLSLTSSYNLGCCDIYPASTGKEGAAVYLMQRWGVDAGHCMLMCDDDNDLGLAAVVHKVYCPSIATASMAAAVAAAPDKFVTSTAHGVLGADMMVQAVLEYAQQVGGGWGGEEGGWRGEEEGVGEKTMASV